MKVLIALHLFKFFTNLTKFFPRDTIDQISKKIGSKTKKIFKKGDIILERTCCCMY